MSDPPRIGIYGGTFDPIHRTHVDIARAARDTAGLDRVLFVVAPEPPHKRDGVHASAEARIELVTLAIADEDEFEASRIEMERPGPSYTADTLVRLHADAPNAMLFLIIGFDSILDLPRWHAPEVILEHAHLLVVPRPGANDPVSDSLAGHYKLLPFETSNISSTDIRRRIAAGEPIDDLVHPRVAQRIHEKDLYRAGR